MHNIRQTYECRTEPYINNAYNNNTNMVCENIPRTYHINKPLNQSRQHFTLKNEGLNLRWYDANGQLVETHHHHVKPSPLLKYNRPAVSYRKAFHEIYNNPQKLHCIPLHNTTDHYHGTCCTNKI